MSGQHRQKGRPFFSRRSLTLVGLLTGIALIVPACTYPTHRWDNFQKYIKRSIERPVTAAGRCEKRGGFPYGQKCYEPSYEEFGEQDCRLRGGLYYGEECFFPEDDRIVIE